MIVGSIPAHGKNIFFFVDVFSPFLTSKDSFFYFAYTLMNEGERLEREIRKRESLNRA